MTAVDDFTIKYERHHENLCKAAQTNKAGVFDALDTAGITSVTAEFDGEGDSGGINSIHAESGGARVELAAIRIPFHEAEFGLDTPRLTQLSLTAAIESLCYNYLEQKHGGWENNEGGYGTFTFDTATRSIDLEFNGRFCDVVTDTYTF